MNTDVEFERLLVEAEEAGFSGWDFSFLQGRMHTEGETWNYRTLVQAKLSEAASLLDMGTGGGEFLTTLTPLPARTVATEGYPPNVEIARSRLAPLGVEVVAIEGVPDNIDLEDSGRYERLPFADQSFDLVINRHESFHAPDVHRILRPGGEFITKQVGGSYMTVLNEMLRGPRPYHTYQEPPSRAARLWNLDFAVRQLEAAGFEIADRREEFPTEVFHDVGAIVYYLKAIPWKIPGFTVDAYRQQLRAIHDRIVVEGPLRVPGYRFYVEALKLPAP